MAFRVLDRVHETTPAGWGGTAPVQLAGAIGDPAGMRAFSAELGSGDETPYVIAGADGEWEETVGAWSPGSPPTLSRLATPIRSSAGGALVDFTAGVKDVFAVVPGAYFEQSPTELTISGGAVTLRQEFHTIDTEGDAALDILDAIAWGPVREGKRVALMAADAGRAVYFAASTTVGLPCLLSAAWPTEFRRVGGKLWPLDSLVLLDRASAAGSAALDFTRGIADYPLLKLVLNNMLPATDGVDMRVRISHAGVWSATTNYTCHISGGTGTSSSYAGAALNSGSGYLLNNAAVGNQPGEGYCGVFHLPAPGAARSHFAWSAGHLGFTDGIGRSAFMGGYNNVAQPVDGLRVMFSSGNIASGEALLYGLRSA